ncbi:MAG: phosphoribosylformylglycinamidine synthase subunit PurQ [Calditrichota bacterium]
MKAAVVVFPGSNCDHDMFEALKLMNVTPEYVWHKTADLDQYDLITLPGGFSYGDYLRCGAIARFSPIMSAVSRAADAGKPVIGVCNGFQILAEAGLLPGALLRNEQLRFVCRYVWLNCENNDTRFTNTVDKEKPLRIPVAHGEGRYFAEDSVIEQLEDNQQVVFRYCNEEGNTVEAANPNGSINNIAGIVNKSGNVLGMMPHPERAMESLLGSGDGRKIFESLIQ